MTVRVQREDFDIGAEVSRLVAGRRDIGAIVTFTGTVRAENSGNAITGMALEHYPGMTERHVEAACGEAAKRWAVQDCLVLHRADEIRVGEPIVLVAVWSAHRGDAMDACRFIIEDLKAHAPFWKKERTAEGGRWVERNTSGYSGPQAAGTEKP